jgi:hypothetical protein
VSKRLAGLLLVAILASSLAGCDLVGHGASPTASHTPATALVPLLPSYPKTLTAANAKTETLRVADQIQDLIASTDIVFVDKHEQLVAKTKAAAGYYGVLRTINVSPSLDAVEQATAMAKLLETAGWIEKQVAPDTGQYLAALSSSSDPTKTWFLILGGDTTNKKPVITIQLASPDLP